MDADDQQRRQQDREEGVEKDIQIIIYRKESSFEQLSVDGDSLEMHPLSFPHPNQHIPDPPIQSLNPSETSENQGLDHLLSQACFLLS